MSSSQESPALPDYEVFAIKYATRMASRASYFIGGDPHDGPAEMAYYVWAIRGQGRCWVVDTGFNPDVGARRGRTLLRTVAECFAAVGIDVADVEQVIITHLHYDHAGTFDSFPKASFHLQDREMAYATGRFMAHRQFNHGYEVDDVVGMVKLAYGNRVVFHDGDDELAPGISVHRIGGHTHGLQCVRVHTQRGWVVLASDASHFYAHFEQRRVFTTMFHVGEAVQGYATLEKLADSRRHIVPGHDPLVLERYPPVSPALAGIAVRLDLEPAHGTASAAS